MMKKVSYILSFAGAVALTAVSMTGPVQAKKAAEWTCSEFLQVPARAKPHVVYFMSGLHKADKLGSADLTPKDFDLPIAKVVDVCRKDHSLSLWSAIADHFYWRAMELP
jgi:hypothetical protein